ncbi:hypothetical protein CWATWH0005_3391 [Crocosphaera watsonii WH 0005]|uniref:Uncharacterized protein n=1 Tax=Crocosphaera watsonii WH 0005 TaxID=423472 RepID=T2IXJ7_CROWT|nr:hypothetical protein CWATWH0005_3391 [Crocosphaera watsonii WH 0005]
MAVSLTTVLIVAIPVLQEIARAARSAEKLFDTLHKEFPPTLHSIRLTGLEITELTDEIDSGVKSASDIVKQVDTGLNQTQTQIKNVRTGTRRLLRGFRWVGKPGIVLLQEPQKKINLNSDVKKCKEI